MEFGFNRISKFFHRQTWQYISDKAIIKYTNVLKVIATLPYETFVLKDRNNAKAE